MRRSAHPARSAQTSLAAAIGLVLALLATIVVPTAHAGGAGGIETLPDLAGGVDGPAHTAELIGDQLWIGDQHRRDPHRPLL